MVDISCILGFFIPITVTYFDTWAYQYITALKNVSEKRKENMQLGLRITIQCVVILLLFASILILFLLGASNQAKIWAIISSILFCFRLCALVFFSTIEITFPSLYLFLFCYSVFMFGGLNQFLMITPSQLTQKPWSIKMFLPHRLFPPQENIHVP